MERNGSLREVMTGIRLVLEEIRQETLEERRRIHDILRTAIGVARGNGE